MSGIYKILPIKRFLNNYVKNVLGEICCSLYFFIHLKLNEELWIHVCTRNMFKLDNLQTFRIIELSNNAIGDS